jgi:hypothetical protein
MIPDRHDPCAPLPVPGPSWRLESARDDARIDPVHATARYSHSIVAGGFELMS